MSYFTRSQFVTELSPSDFDPVATWKLKNHPDCALVLFYSNWCGHCKAMKQDYEDFAKKASFMDVLAFDCAAHEGHLSKIQNDMPQLVRGFPTLVFYSNGQPTEQYQGDRSRASLLKESIRVCQSS